MWEAEMNVTLAGMVVRTRRLVPGGRVWAHPPRRDDDIGRMLAEHRWMPHRGALTVNRHEGTITTEHRRGRSTPGVIVHWKPRRPLCVRKACPWCAVGSDHLASR